MFGLIDLTNLASRFLFRLPIEKSRSDGNSSFDIDSMQAESPTVALASWLLASSTDFSLVEHKPEVGSFGAVFFVAGLGATVKGFESESVGKNLF